MKTPVDRSLLELVLKKANASLLKKHGLSNCYPTSEEATTRIIELLNNRSLLNDNDIKMGIDDDSLDDIRLLISTGDGSIIKMADKVKLALA